MKASEIKAVLTARPNAIFFTNGRSTECVRIVEVREDTHRTRGQNRTTTTYVVDISNFTVGYYRPTVLSESGAVVDKGWDESPSYVIKRSLREWSPRDIYSVVEKEQTLEQYCEEWLAKQLTKYEQQKQDTDAYNEMVKELMLATGISKYTIQSTNREVLVALRNALKSSVSA